VSFVRSRAHPPCTPRGCANAPRGGVCARVRNERSTAYTLTLRSVTSDVPEMIRMRRLLKCMLRSFCFKCVDIKQIRTAKASPGDAVTTGPSDASTREIERTEAQ
jgi:hypothetical protein